jgi:hypothetical protein
MRKEDFTRVRKQPFSDTLLLMFNMLRRSMAIEIKGFLSYLNVRSGSDRESFTTSAFSQNRQKIDPGVFNYLSDVIVENYYVASNADLRFWKQFRVLAVDGSRITLPFNQKLKELFGVNTNQSLSEVVQGTVSILYDLLNGIILEASLNPLHSGERELALKHSQKWKTGDLIIYDRGYMSYDFICEHVALGIQCLIRAKTSHSLQVIAFLKGGKQSEVVDFLPDVKKNAGPEDVPIKVRFVRVELPGGVTEVLVTTLLDSKKYPSKGFKELYFKRWGIETLYDQLKNKLKLEYFTGYSHKGILQDFNCAVFISNIQSVIVNDIQEELAVRNQNRQYDYKVNANLSYGNLKDIILELLGNQAPIDKIFKELQALFLEYPVPIRPGRTKPRKTGMYRSKTKPKVTKNQRDAI